MNIEKNKSILIPDKNDYLGDNIYLPEECYTIKECGNLSFLYYKSCFICLDNYLKIQGNIIKLLRKRELGI